MADPTSRPSTRRTGSITRLDDRRWLVQVFLGRDSEGRQMRHKKTIHGTKKDAERYLTGVLRERDLGQFVEASRLSLNAYLENWLQVAARPKLSNRTFQDYTEIVQRYLRDTIGRTRLDRLTPVDIQALYTRLVQAQNLSAPTVRKLHAVLSSALKQAVRWRQLGRNPAADVELPKAQRGRRVMAMDSTQVVQFLRAADGNRWENLFHFAVSTGMRPEEYLALQWDDVDFLTGTVKIERVLVRARKQGGWSFEKPKTPSSRRSIVLPGSVVPRLRQHKARQNQERLAAGPAYQDHDLVFAGSMGAPLDSANLLQRYMRPVLAAAGLPKLFNLYTLRHTCATLLLQSGENAKVVSERLGHASVVLTLDTYASVLPTMQRAAADRLEAALYGR